MVYQQAHPYHLVSKSAWPILTALAVFNTLLGVVLGLHGLLNPFGFVFFILNTGVLAALLFRWWGDVTVESFLGYHTEEVATGLRLGFILFIVSEVMFFFSFFWGFFYLAISPSIFIGCQWPPFGINPIHAWGVPLLNTLCLLLSGVTVTYAHQAILEGDHELAETGLYSTLCCACAFMAFQFFEYLFAPFNISDSAFGSTFFLLTGFHGFHVLVGSIFLRVCQIRHENNHFTPDRHLGLEMAIWYWHFVDVVWLFLFAVVYVWGGYR